jgi:hypothetical protein
MVATGVVRDKSPCEPLLALLALLLLLLLLLMAARLADISLPFLLTVALPPALPGWPVQEGPCNAAPVIAMKEQHPQSWLKQNWSTVSQHGPKVSQHGVMHGPR